MANTAQLYYIIIIFLLGVQPLYDCKIIPKVISSAKKYNNLFGTKGKAKDLKCDLTMSIGMETRYSAKLSVQAIKI